MALLWHWLISWNRLSLKVEKIGMGIGLFNDSDYIKIIECYSIVVSIKW